MDKIADPEVTGTPLNLWPPALELPNGKWLSQTAAIVDYLSPKLGLAGYAKDDANADEEDKAFSRTKNLQLVLTALDLATEVSVVRSGRFADRSLSGVAGPQRTSPGLREFLLRRSEGGSDSGSGAVQSHPPRQILQTLSIRPRNQPRKQGWERYRFFISFQTTDE